MKISTLNYVAGKDIEEIGVVRGNVAYSKHIGKDLMAGFKNIAGGEIKSYTEMLEEAREIATQKVITQADSIGADAVINLRYDSSSVVDGTVEVIAYGTAVKVK